MEAVRELGSVISGEPALIHHCIGRSAKIKGVGNIGHWFLLPLTDQEHKDLHNGIMIWEQSHPDLGIETRKQFEKTAFYEVMLFAVSDDRPPKAVIDAITDWSL